MSELSGIENLDYYRMWEIADHILVNEAHGFPLRDWEKENLNEIMIANDYTFYISFATNEMGRMVSGKLLNRIVQNMKEKVANKAQNELFIFGIVSLNLFKFLFKIIIYCFFENNKYF